MEQVVQHVIDKFTSDCGTGFGVLFVVVIIGAIGFKIVLTMWGADRKNLLDTIIKMQENLAHASENMDKIVMALATRVQSPGDCD
jgi:hypothetical protein